MLDSQDIDHVLAHTASVWTDFAYGRFFVTGGTGFVGKWLIETLLAANKLYNLNIDVTILTRNAKAFREKFPHLAAVDLIEGDIRSFAYPDGSFTHIIHAATDMVADADMYNIIVEGTRRVVQFAETQQIKNLLYISSGAIYGKQPVDMSHLTEDCTATPYTAYGQGKLAAEKLVTDYTIARLFAVTGPYLPLNANYAAGNFVRYALDGGPIKVMNGAPLRSYLYAADMTIWLWTLLAKDTRGAIYNIGSEEAISIAALAQHIAALTGCTVEDDLAPTGVPESYIPSTAKARSQFGLEQLIALDEGLRRMIAWNRARL